MMLACTLQRMTPAEALKGATSIAAARGGAGGQAGEVARGGHAAPTSRSSTRPDVNHWLYHFRPNACVLTLAAGRVAWQAPPS